MHAEAPVKDKRLEDQDNNHYRLIHWYCVRCDEASPERIAYCGTKMVKRTDGYHIPSNMVLPEKECVVCNDLLPLPCRGCGGVNHK